MNTNKIAIIQELDNFVAELASVGTNLEVINKSLEAEISPTDETISIWSISSHIETLVNKLEAIRDTIDPF